MKKFLIVFLIIFFAITKSILAENQEIAELEVVEVVKTEVLQNQEKAPVFP
jgi:ribosomal protein S3AE